MTNPSDLFKHRLDCCCWRLDNDQWKQCIKEALAVIDNQAKQLKAKDAEIRYIKNALRREKQSHAKLSTWVNKLCHISRLKRYETKLVDKHAVIAHIFEQLSRQVAAQSLKDCD